MEIGLIDVDGHNFPNLALMKISAWHKTQGDSVEWWNGFKHYDRVYQSKVFDSTYTPDNEFCIQADEVIKGGTGYIGKVNIEWGEPVTGRVFEEEDFFFNGEWVQEIEDSEGTKYWLNLPSEIEHTTPDYALYGITDTAYGFLTRGCPRACPFCIVAEKEGRKSVKVADLSEWWNGQKVIKLLDPNTLACREHLDLLKQLAQSGAWVDFTQGIDARMLTEENIHMLNAVKTKTIHFAWDLMQESDPVLRGLALYKKYGSIKDDRKLRVYVLVNYDTTQEENLYRIYHLRELGFDPYVMIYDKPHASKEVKRLQRWVNNKFIWRSCERFEDYK